VPESNRQIPRRDEDRQACEREKTICRARLRPSGGCAAQAAGSL